MNREALEDLFEREVRDGNDNYKLCCPFHDERTPSFLIHKDMGLAYCWGCGWHGSVVTAIRDYCNISSDRARELVARELGFRLVEGILKRRETLAQRAKPQVFPESWLAAWPHKIHKSILERGLTVETLRDAGSRYDVRGGRQVFPHRNKRGSLLGVAGRTCRGQDPKWLFYWDYSKGRSLYYGTNQGESRSGNHVVVTEGVFDVLWFQQHGIQNVVGILGSKPSKYQIAELRNYETVTFALDNDEAGRAGTEKLRHSLRKSAKLRQISWPDGVNDAMDMQGEDLWEIISTAKTPLQMQLQKKQWISAHFSSKRTKAMAMPH